MKKLILGAAAVALLAGCGGPSFDEQVSAQLPAANIKKAKSIADVMCHQGMFAGAFALGNANNDTSDAALAYTIHECHDTFVDQMTALAKAGSDGDGFTTGIKALKALDPDNAEQVLAFATAGDN